MQIWSLNDLCTALANYQHSDIQYYGTDTHRRQNDAMARVRGYTSCFRDCDYESQLGGGVALSNYVRLNTGFDVMFLILLLN